MDSPASIIIIILITLYAGYIINSYFKYFSLPTLKSYLKVYPHCHTSHGIKCCNCGSKSIRNWGIKHSNSFFRIHNCNHCGVSLYRS